MSSCRSCFRIPMPGHGLPGNRSLPKARHSATVRCRAHISLSPHVRWGWIADRCPASTQTRSIGNSSGPYTLRVRRTRDRPSDASGPISFAILVTVQVKACLHAIRASGLTRHVRCCSTREGCTLVQAPCRQSSKSSSQRLVVDVLALAGACRADQASLTLQR